MTTQLQCYTTYNFWANELLLSLIEKDITDEMLDREIVSSFPSLRKTVYHVWDAEFIWLRRLKGESLDNWPGKTFKGSFTEAKNGLLLNDKAFINYVNDLDDEKLNKSFSYLNIEGKSFTNPVWESVLHCMNHSTYHRGQIITMLRQLGKNNLPSTDFISYCRLK